MGGGVGVDIPESASRGIIELSRLLLSEETLETSLRRTAELAVSVIPSCQTCGVTLVESDRIETRVALDDVAERVDAHQYETGEGPCLEAIRTGKPMKIESVPCESRWPRFTKRAGEEGLESSYSVPLVVHGDAVGALNLYSLSRPFTDEDERVAGLFAEQAAVALTNAWTYEKSRQLVSHLHEALESRDLIGQAKGIIMERERCSADEAFAMLRAVSQQWNVKLREVAREFVQAATKAAMRRSAHD
jgi:GAF domain-containing protein